MADFSSYKIKENYKLCEYIELDNPDGETTPTSSPYIDTGWKYTKQKLTNVILDVATIYDSSPNFSFGSTNGSSEDNSVDYFGVGAHGQWWFNWNSVDRSKVPQTIYNRTQFIFKYCPEQDADYWYYKGNRIVQDSSTPTSCNVQNNNTYLFAINTSVSPKTSYRRGGRIYRFIVIEEGRLVRHMVPVIDSTNTPGMYDLVEGKFYTNANTSATVEFTYKLAHNQLPFGYKECEWIETVSSGTNPYIDTGWKMDITKNPFIYAELSVDSTATNYNYLMGSGNASTDNLEDDTEENVTRWCLIGLNGNAWMPNGMTYTSLPTVTIGTKYPIELSKGISTSAPDYYYWVINNTGTTYTNVTQVNNFTLFGANAGGSVARGYNTRMYRFFIKEPFTHGEELSKSHYIRDMIPCLNENNEPGMYDRVHGKFYGGDTGATTSFRYQVKEQVWPSNIRRVGWIQSNGSAYASIHPYITLQEMLLDKYIGFKVRASWESTAETDETNTSNRGIIGNNYDSNHSYGLFRSYGNGVFRFGTCSAGPETLGDPAPKGLNNVYELIYNYKFPDTCLASWTNVNTTASSIKSPATRASSVGVTAPLFLFKEGSNAYNFAWGTIRLYDAEVTQYGNVIHHYVPCIDINQDNKPCVYDTKTNEIFYETPDDNVTEHLTWGY